MDNKIFDKFKTKSNFLDNINFNTKVGFIKIDVEGYELQVIRGAADTIEALRPVIYFEAKRLPGTVKVIETLQKAGYRCYWHFAAFFQPNNFRQKAENLFGGRGDMNVLAVPQDEDQPEDLPEIGLPDEDWQPVYVEFFRLRGTSMP